MQIGKVASTLVVIVALSAGVAWAGATLQARQTFEQYRASIIPVSVDEPLERVDVTSERDGQGSYAAWATAQTAHYVLVHDLRALGCERAISGRASVDTHGLARIEALRVRVGESTEMAGFAVRAAGPWQEMRDCARLSVSATGQYVDGGRTVVLIH